MPSQTFTKSLPVLLGNYSSESFNAKTLKLTSTSGLLSIAGTSIDFQMSRSWTRTPGYRALVAAGEVLPDNPLTVSVIANGTRSGSATYFSSSPDGSWTRQVRNATCENVYVPNAISDPWTISHHASKLIKKAKGSEWNTPVFFAELGKTAEMVVTAVNRIINLFLALRKGNFRRFVDLWHPSAKRRLSSRRSFARANRRFLRQYGRTPRQAVESAWLEYKYGWTPFILDTYNMVQTLDDLRNKPQAHVGSVVSVLNRVVRSEIKSPDRLTKVTGIQCGGVIAVTHDISSKVTWRFKTNENVNIIGKVGLTNPLVVGWELVPLSFVADWFLPIGDYLATLDASYRLAHVGGTVGFKDVCSTYTSCVPPKGYRFFPSGFPSGRRTTVTVTKLTAIPSIKLLDLSLTANLQHGRAISAIALLSGLLRRH